MKSTLFLIIFSLGILKVSFTQDISLPEKITISDMYSSPWSDELYYSYELNLNDNNYDIKRTMLREGDKKKYLYKKIGQLDAELVKQILLELQVESDTEINPNTFTNIFASDSIDSFLNNNGSNYWITTELQKQFIIEELTDLDKLKKNLKSYYRNYDQSGWIDGSSTEVNITFHFHNSTTSISSKSILWYGLPLVVNNRKNYSIKLAKLIGELIPKSKTERYQQFSGEKLFYAVVRETINTHRKTINRIGAKVHQVHLDSLSTHFKLLDARIINATYSVNWNGGKRLYCELKDTSLMLENVTLNYSTLIENNKIQFPVSLIISDYQHLYEKVLEVDFFRNYLMENQKRQLTITYDNNSCFTEKTKRFVIDDCILNKINIDFDKAIFVSLSNEFGSYSRWVILPNGKYFVWWNNRRETPKPIKDDNFLQYQKD